MFRPVLAALLLLCTPAWSLAQESEKPAATAQDPQAALKELTKSLQKAVNAWRKEAMQQVKAAQEAGKPMPAIAMQPPTGEFISKAQELAEQYAGTDDAIPFLAFICKSASTERNAVKKAVVTLADHTKSERIGDVVPFLGMVGGRFNCQEQAEAVLESVINDNPSDKCKAQGLIARGAMRLEAATNDDERAAAAADLRKVAEITKDEDLVKEAKDALFEIEHLQLGCTVPEIVAKDIDGVEFKLSDYRGKVVLLDFWGFW